MRGNLAKCGEMSAVRRWPRPQASGPGRSRFPRTQHPAASSGPPIGAILYDTTTCMTLKRNEGRVSCSPSTTQTPVRLQSDVRTMAETRNEEVSPGIDVFPSSTIAPVSANIFSGFLEHLGRCIYGGILPSNRTTFPYTPRKPCPEDQFASTPESLLTPEGFRADVLQVLRDELRVPLVRWPGGNFVSSYNWKDGIGPKEERKRRPELAWNGEESNRFGTDEYVVVEADRKIGLRPRIAGSLLGVALRELNRISCSTWEPERSRMPCIGSNTATELETREYRDFHADRRSD